MFVAAVSHVVTEGSQHITLLLTLTAHNSAKKYYIQLICRFHCQHVSIFLFYPTVSERFLVCWFPGGDVGGPEEKSQVTSLLSPSFLLQFESLSTHPCLAAGATRTQPVVSLFSKPTAEVLTEYTRKVDFLKGLLEAEKLVGGLLQLVFRKLDSYLISSLPATLSAITDR